jgi:hypothetical protein
MNDDYRNRMLAITELLRAQRVGPYTSAPPIYRLAWRLGLHVRPPLYQSFTPLALGMGALFGPLWGLLMWLSEWRGQARAIPLALVSTLLAGIIFGVTMAGYYRWKARHVRLPPLDLPTSATP